MHDPMVVAFEIRRPWPRRSRANDAKPGQPRWVIRYHHDCGKYGCEERHTGQRFFPWWKPGSYMSAWVLAGRGFYWPALITIWHVEPGGHDSGKVCRHYVRTQQPDGTYRTRVTHAWRWHVHHWRIRVAPLQAARRWLLTRCEWCGGPSRKGDLVNVSHRWNGERGPWWRGERNLFHHDCSSIEYAHRTCICDDPMIERGGSFGTCARCGKHAAGKKDYGLLARLRLLASVPQGCRDPEIVKQVAQMVKDERVSDADS
jgi:hypothetical protein